MAKLKFIFVIIFLILCFACQNGKNNAETKVDFSKGSGISKIKLDAQKTEDLALLGKVWGFLKYYHPKVAKGKYNWDLELFKILPKIISCENIKERNSILYNWIYSLGAFRKEDRNKTDSSGIKYYPDLDWIAETSKLGDSLSKKLIEVKNAKRTGENYYVQLSRIRTPIFTNEDSCTQFKFPDFGYRMLCLFRYWNCIEYFYPSKYLIGEHWNNVLMEFIPKFANDSNQLDYELTVSEMTARIHDSYSSIICTDSTWMNYVGKYVAAAKVGFVENKATVIDFYDHELGQNSGLEKGDIILNIKNKSVDEIVKESIPYYYASNYPTTMRNIAAHLLRSQDTLLNITFLRGDSIKSTNLKCFLFKQNIFREEYFTNRDTCLKYLTPQICYLYAGTLKNKYLQDVMPRFMKTKGMIIDFRSYPSDGFDLEKYLCYGKTNFLKYTYGNLIDPGLFRFSSIAIRDFNNPNYYKGKVVIIVNAETQSYFAGMSMCLRSSPNAIIIGSTTAGANWGFSRIILVGGIQTYISGIGVYYPDGRETQRIGIVPDVEVHPTIKGIREGRDELLEKAIEIINSK